MALANDRTGTTHHDAHTKGSKVIKNPHKQSHQESSPSAKGITSNTKEFLEKSWRSGVQVFGQNKPVRRRNSTPWWASEKENSNPRVLPVYRPWWTEKNFAVEEENWKLPALQTEAKRRGLSSKGNKKELIDRINASYLQYRLTDDNFTSSVFDPAPECSFPGCYPEEYDKLEISR
jgi:PAB1-binding protein PBP1